MPGQSIVIDRLWQGVSGQAIFQRKHGTVEDAVNVRFDLRIGGAVKRQPTELVLDLSPFAGLTLDPDGEYHWASIRGIKIAIASGDDVPATTSILLAWDEFGTPLQVVDKTAGGFKDYLTGGVGTELDALVDIDVSASFDTLIVVNRKRDMGAAIQDAWTYQQMFNFIVKGDEDDGASAINDLTDEANEITNFSDLPPDADNTAGDVRKVLFDEGFDPAGIYIFFDTPPLGASLHPDYPDGYFPRHDNWFRVPLESQAEARYDWAVMPYRVIADDVNNQVLIDFCPWRQRVSGRPATIKKMPWAEIVNEPNPVDPPPDFTRTLNTFNIRSVEFFSGRLFLISQKHVTSSRNDDYFNLWVDNVSAIGDADRISIDITQNDIGAALRATACGQGLFVMTENGQLDFSSGEDRLTNVNGRIRTITKFPSRDLAPSAGPGMVTIIDDFDDVHQYQWSGGGDPAIIYSDMLTAHDPRRLENKPVRRHYQIGMTVFIELASGDVEVHDTFIVGEQTVQSAWGTHQYRGALRHASQWKSRIHFIQHTATLGFSILTYLHRIQPVLSPDLYVPRMDRMQLVQPGAMTYDADSDTTTITHTGAPADLARSAVVTRGPEVGGFRYPISINGNDGVYDGKLDDVAQWLGFRFDFLLELNKLYVRLSGARETTKGLTVFYFESTDFILEWLQTPLATKTNTKSWQAHRVGVAQVGQPSFETSSLDVAMATDPRDAIVRIKTDSPGQVAIQALEYELMAQGRGKT